MEGLAFGRVQQLLLKQLDLFSQRFPYWEPLVGNDIEQRVEQVVATSRPNSACMLAQSLAHGLERFLRPRVKAYDQVPAAKQTHLFR